MGLAQLSFQKQGTEWELFWADGDSVSSRGATPVASAPPSDPNNLEESQEGLWDPLISFGRLPSGLARDWRPWVPLD